MKPIETYKEIQAMKDDGGPAFPVSEEDARGKVSGVYGGATLLDYFAAKAMQGILSGWRDGDACHADDVADMAFNVARAMLKARES